MKLEGQNAVITGGASGIGAAIARRFAAEGARVAIADLDAERAEQVAQGIAEAGGKRPLVQPLDVSDSAAVAAFFDSLDEREWPIDVLVNNAGNTESALTPTAEVDDQTWDAVLRVHLSGTFYCTRAALSRMLPRQRGVVINMGSVAGLRGLPGATAYTAAKGGVIALTKAVSQEVAPQGIRVNCIAPGWIATPMLDKLPQHWRPRMIEHTPLGRLGEPEEVAAVALFLASDESSFITGQVVSPNGGLHC